MANERASVFQTTQIGAESVAGTGVTPSKRLLCTSIEPTPEIPVEPYRPLGAKYPTTATKQKETVSANIQGTLAYNDIVYLLSGIMRKTTPTTPGGASLTRRWSFDTNAFGPDDVQTFTVQAGSASLAEKFAYGLVNSLTLRFNKTEASVNGSMIGQVLEEVPPVNEVQTIDVGGASSGTYTLTFGGQTASNIAFDANAATVQGLLQGLSSIGAGNATVALVSGKLDVTFAGALAGTDVALIVGNFAGLTGATNPAVTEKTKGGPASPTDVTELPVSPETVSVFIANDEAGLSAGRLTRCLEVELSFQDRFSGIVTVDDSEDSFSAHVEKAPNLTASLVVEQDSTAQGYLDDLRDRKTKICKITCEGDDIETNFPYKITITFPFKFRQPQRGDRDDVYAGTYEMTPVYDSTFGGVLKVEVDTALTTL